MKIGVLSSLILAIAVGAFAAAPGLAGQRTENAAGLTEAVWYSDPVDSGDDMGAAVSMAYDPARDITYISYYDQAHGDLRVARSAVSGGNCGPKGDWICETVDGNAAHGNTHVGLYTSIALDPLTGFPGVAYYDVTNASLKYAAYVCTPHECAWVIATIDEGDPNLSVHVGLFPSLQYDLNRAPHIAYHRDYTFPGGDVLHYAHAVDGGGNCGPANTWICEAVDSGDGMGLYPSLDLSTPEDLPHIAYYDGTNQDLKYAWYLGNGMGNCGEDDWRCMVIDSAGDVGRHASFHAPDGASQVPNIAYYDRTNGAVKVAYWVGPGGNCAGGEWQCDTVDDVIGSVSDPVGLSLQTYSDGSPVIAYQCPTCYCTAIRQAHYVGALGNCGPVRSIPPGLTTRTWRCSTVVYGIDDGCHSVGMFLDLSISPTDLGSVAYYDAPAGDLMVAYQRVIVYLPLLIQ